MSDRRDNGPQMQQQQRQDEEEEDTPSLTQPYSICAAITEHHELITL